MTYPTHLITHIVLKNAQIATQVLSNTASHPVQKMLNAQTSPIRLMISKKFSNLPLKATQLVNKLWICINLQELSTFLSPLPSFSASDTFTL